MSFLYVLYYETCLFKIPHRSILQVWNLISNKKHELFNSIIGCETKVGGKDFIFGKQTFVIVTNADTDSINYENAAFETNNFLAPVYFCLVSQEQFQRYSDQLMQAWSKIQPYMDQSDVEDLPESNCFSKELQWQIPCTNVAEQLRLSFPCTLGHFSSLSLPEHQSGNLIDPCTAIFCCRYSFGAVAIFLVHGRSCP